MQRTIFDYKLLHWGGHEKQDAGQLRVENLEEDFDFDPTSFPTFRTG